MKMKRRTERSARRRCGPFLASPIRVFDDLRICVGAQVLVEQRRFVVRRGVGRVGYLWRLLFGSGRESGAKADRGDVRRVCRSGAVIDGRPSPISGPGTGSTGLKVVPPMIAGLRRVRIRRR